MDLLTTSQAATELGVKQRDVQNYVKKGYLPAQRFGRAWMIRREDLKGFERPKPGRRWNTKEASAA